jgi:methionine-rich copper-binding protein CopC
MQHFLIPVSTAVDAVDLDPDDWILTRSLTVSAFQDGPPKIVAVDPAPGSALRVGEPLSMTLTFHEDVVLERAHLTLRRIGGGEHDLRVTYDAETFTATVTSRQPLAGGGYELYELIVSDDIVDVANGLALDGEMDADGKTSLLPSGDGVPGGDAVIKFGVGGTRRPSSRVRPAG